MRIATARHPLLIGLMLAMALNACGGSGEKSKTQVVARVNGEEVTVSQLNQAIGQMGPEAAVNPAEAGKNALESIIDETIGVQAALKMKMDREPEILQAVEAAKRRVLVEAYLERTLQKTPFPTSAEVHEYFSRHPELFANRRIYVFNQITAMAGRESISSLVEKVAGIDNLSEFVAWLKKKGVGYNVAYEVKPSEQLPAELLAQMQKLKAGDLAYWSAADGVVLTKVVQIFDKPLTEREAQPLIERYLARQKQAMAEQQLFKEMRANAEVEYLGEFKSDTPLTQAVTPQAEEVAPANAKPPLTSGGHKEEAPQRVAISRQEDTGEHLGAP